MNQIKTADKLENANQAYSKAYVPHDDATWIPFKDGYEAAMLAQTPTQLALELEIAELKLQNQNLRLSKTITVNMPNVAAGSGGLLAPPPPQQPEPSEAEKELEALKSHVSGMARAAENSAKHAAIEIEALRVRASGLRAQLKESIAYMEIVMETEHHPSYYPTLTHAIEVFLKHAREAAEHD